ncbi:hypothetical protein BC937DRAFT_88301 [Endogone sp. FLAS-F59071]|nr:hypothetical protein BC937DRAFT_88301 [Endogone sp. FLAS-F59071]|eukprot:RUS18827.1 hypothetical protein BC937DRAFT_88301 [Endogone sp. FLAS-F59071]
MIPSLGNLLCLGFLLAMTSAAAARAFTPIDLVTMPRPGIVSPSPNGNLMVFAKSRYDEIENKVRVLLI